MAKSGSGPVSKRVRVDDDADTTPVASAAAATTPIPMATAANPVASAAVATHIPMATAANPVASAAVATHIPMATTANPVFFAAAATTPISMVIAANPVVSAAAHIPMAIAANPNALQANQQIINQFDACNLTLCNTFIDLPNVTHSRLQPGSEEYNQIVRPMNANSGFFSVAVYSIKNELLRDHFNIAASHLQKTRGKSNIITAYHCTSFEAIRYIMNSGFNIGLSRGGYFGKGIYFSQSFLKANYYCQRKGKPTAIRAMLVCDVALGQTYNFEPGLFARDLVQPPKNKDSVSGFISGDSEYIVYDSNKALPRYLVIYQYTNTTQETQQLSRIPPSCKDLTKICLSERLGDLFGRILVATNSETESIINALIDGLRRRKIDAAKFLKHITNILNINYREENLDIKIMEELDKSEQLLKNLSASVPSTNSGAGAAAAYTAPTVPTAPAATIASKGSVISGAAVASIAHTASTAPTAPTAPTTPTAPNATVASKGSVISGAAAASTAPTAPTATIASKGSVVYGAASAPPTTGSNSANASALIQRTSMDVAVAEALLVIGNTGAKLAADEVEDDDIIMEA